MSEMPPPPPANVPPPPPPGPGFDANAAMDQFKGADPLDLAVVGAGVLAFILSIFHGFYTAKIEGYEGYGGGSTSAWHGFFGWAGVLLLLVAGVVTALKIIKIAVPQQAIIVAGTAVVGLLFILLALVVDPVETGGGFVKIGHGWSYWIILILALGSAGISGLKVAKARGLA